VGAGLHLDLLNPGILPGRLIKMAVDDHVSLGAGLGGQRIHASPLNANLWDSSYTPIFHCQPKKQRVKVAKD
jgi:hypothetical protein